VLYYLLTGKHAFDRRIVQDEDGKEIEVEGRKFNIKLENNGKRLEELTEEVHETDIDSALQEVPRRFRKFFYKCFSDHNGDRKKSIRSVDQLKDEFEKLKPGFFRKIGDRIIKGARFAIPVAVASAVIGGFGSLVYYVPREEPPTLKEIMNQEDFYEFNYKELEELNEIDEVRIKNRLIPYMERVRDEYPGLLKKIEAGEIEEYDSMTYMLQRDNRLHKRLSQSLIIAGYLNPDFFREFEKDNNERIYPSYVPREWVEYSQMKNQRALGHVDEETAIWKGLSYLKLCVRPGNDVTDTFSEYFSNSDDIKIAVMRSESINYLPYTNDEGHIRSGYSKFLPDHQRDLINTALAVYFLSDEEGELNFKNIPKLSVEERMRLGNMPFESQ
ncbi:hypothetical protein GOV12_01840, partial [Candidatus Pacearchaeota archaeon]|nr:hypothetical protein [Candidatus Pacearchaeota archaeon]